MIILDATNKSLEILLGGAITTNQLPIVVSFVDILNSDQSISSTDENDLLTNSGTAVTLISSPASGHSRVLKTLSVQQADTVDAQVIIRYNVGGVFRNILVATLTSGDNLGYEDQGGFYVLDDTGARKQSAAGAGINQLTGNVTAGPGSGSQVATIPSNTVTEAMQNLSDNTTNDVSITKHGYAPKAPNDATKFLDGTGVYSTPAGSGNVSAGGTLTNHAIVLGQGSTNVGVVASLGTNHQVLHGNASGDPTFSAVDLANDVTGTLSVANLPTNVKTKQINFTANNNGTALTTSFEAETAVEYDGTIIAVTLAADQSGSIQLDIQACARSSYPASLASIVASAPPTLSSAAQSQDTTLTGWTTTVTADSIYRFIISSVSTITRVNCVLTVQVI